MAIERLSMKNKASIAEILHAKDPKKFAALVAHLIMVGLVKPEAAAGDSWFGGRPGKLSPPAGANGNGQSGRLEAA